MSTWATAAWASSWKSAARTFIPDLYCTPPPPCTPGIVGLDLLHAYIHDTFRYLTYRAYRLGTNGGIHRNQPGINFRREPGQTYSARDP